jgi:hypothetical protein
VAIQRWIDQPDLWCLTAMCVCLSFLLLKRWYLSIAAFVLAVCCKENAWILIPVMLIIAASKGSLREIPKPAYVTLGAACVGLALIRIHVGFAHSDPGNFHSNSRWLVRYLEFIFGDALTAATMAPAPLLGALVGLLASTPLSLRAKIYGSAATGAVVCLMYALINRMPVAISVLVVFDNQTSAPQIAWEAIYVWLLIRFLRTCDRRATLSLVAAYLLTGMIVAINPKESEHILYIPSAFRAALLAYMIVALARQCYAHWQMLRPRWNSVNVVHNHARDNSADENGEHNHRRQGKPRPGKSCINRAVSSMFTRSEVR